MDWRDDPLFVDCFEAKEKILFERDAMFWKLSRIYGDINLLSVGENLYVFYVGGDVVGRVCLDENRGKIDRSYFV